MLQKKKVLEYICQQIRELVAVNRMGTAQNYKTVYNSLSSYLQSVHQTDLAFQNLVPEMVVGYEQWLHCNGVTRNSSSCYLRILRACYNKYVSEQFDEHRRCRQPDEIRGRKNRHTVLASSTSLFADVYMGIAKTRKRAISSADLSRLAKLDIRKALIQQGKDAHRKGFDECVERLSRSRDFFLFCFCSRGLTFVDLAYLSEENVVDGVIHYFRRKTGQEMTVKIEPQMSRILAKYRKMKASHSRYLFPMISSDIPSEAHWQYRHALCRYNHDLHTLGELLRITASHACRNVTLTSYVSRHTWATCAHHGNIPISVISQAMGHSSVHTTEIYLKSFEQSVVDDANHKLMAQIFSCNS